jgi:FHA domain-containing protein
MSTCLACGHANVLGTLFCDECGYDLTSTAHGPCAMGDAMAGMAAMTETAAGMWPGRLTTADTAAAASIFAPAGPDASDDELPWAPTKTAAPPDDGAVHPSSTPAGSGSMQPAMATPHERAPSRRPDGATAATAAVYLISDAGRRIDVPAQDVVIVGREDMRSGIRPDVDLTLDGASAAGISRRHCRLLQQPEGWYVEDLMSTNYTVLNGKPLQAHVPVRVIHGDELRLGKLRLRFCET